MDTPQLDSILQELKSYISENLPLSSNERPEIDLELMKKAGFKAEVDREIWKTVWDEAEQINFAYAPMFMLTGRKD